MSEMATNVTTHTLTVDEAIVSRHSVRTFEQKPIPREDLTKIMELVRLAPSAWNLQPWRFQIITDPTLKEKLQEAAYGQKQVTSAPAVIIVSSDMEDVVTHLSDTVHPNMSAERKEEEVANLAAIFGGMSVEERGQWGLNQTNIALGFLLIAIEGMGYASVPMLGFDQEKVKDILELPKHVKFAAMVPMGKASDNGYPHFRHELERIVTFR